eukprot:6178792-Pleurochrysis_carterae.AAC.2
MPAADRVHLRGPGACVAPAGASASGTSTESLQLRKLRTWYGNREEEGVQDAVAVYRRHALLPNHTVHPSYRMLERSIALRRAFERGAAGQHPSDATLAYPSDCERVH